MCVLITLPDQPKRYVFQTDDKKIPCLGVPFIDIHVFFIILFFIFCWNIYIFCLVFQNDLVSVNCLRLLFSLIKIIIISTELYVPDGYIHILSFILDTLFNLLLFWGVPSRLIKRVKIPLSRVIVFSFFCS